MPIQFCHEVSCSQKPQRLQKIVVLVIKIWQTPIFFFVFIQYCIVLRITENNYVTRSMICEWILTVISYSVLSEFSKYIHVHVHELINYFFINAFLFTALKQWIVNYELQIWFKFEPYESCHRCLMRHMIFPTMPKTVIMSL